MSSILSGKLLPFVSGSNMHTNPARMGANPKMNVGNHGIIDEVFEMNGAAIDPILIAVELAPIPIFRITVGYSSEV